MCVYFAHYVIYCKVVPIYYVFIYIHTYIYICVFILHTMSFTVRLCQYATCFGSAEPSSGACINVTNTDP
jgi:hypothetical protein